MSLIDENELEHAPLSRKKKRVFRMVALLLGLIVGLGFAEVCLRIIGWSSPEFYAPDKFLGYSLIPGVSGWYTREGRNFVAINHAGFHDTDRTIDKTAGTYRIAVIGDSYVEALQVSRNEAFTTILGERVADCSKGGNAKVEVLSFGVSGYGTAQELILLREKVAAYRPDAVLLMVTTNNDISDNIRDLKGTPIPYFVIKDGQLIVDDGFRDDRTYIARSSTIGRLGVSIENNLRFVQATRAVIRNLKVWNRERTAKVETQPTPGPAVAEPVYEAGIDVQIYRPPTDETWIRAWSVTEAILLQMKSDVNALGARFVVATGSNGVQVLPAVETRKQFAETLGVADLFYPDRRVAEFGRVNNIAVVTLAPYLAEYAAREKVNLHGFEGNIGYGHWNRYGHRVAGEELGKRLCSELFQQ